MRAGSCPPSASGSGLLGCQGPRGKLQQMNWWAGPAKEPVSVSRAGRGWEGQGVSRVEDEGSSGWGRRGWDEEGRVLRSVGPALSKPLRPEWQWRGVGAGRAGRLLALVGISASPWAFSTAVHISGVGRSHLNVSRTGRFRPPDLSFSTARASNPIPGVEQPFSV